MGISKFLKSGKLKINLENKLLEIDGNNLRIPYSMITNTDWGYVYEKYVGQTFEDDGYEVIYNGLNFGYLDNGIDLIAKKETIITLIQCKYHKGKISKNKIEWILYKASNEVYKTYYKENKKIIFMLVVNCYDDNFSEKEPIGMNLNKLPSNNIKYPLIRYFLYHNNIQEKVKLEIREIRMII